MGKVVVTGTAAIFAYLAYSEPVKTGNNRFRLFAAAAGIVGAIVPYTIFVSYPFNEAINGQLGATESEKTDLKKLVADWGRTDWKVSLLAFVGTVVGVCGALACAVCYLLLHVQLAMNGHNQFIFVCNKLS